MNSTGAGQERGGVDLHAHILPGLDDGPETVDEAVQLLRLLVEDGVSVVVATPHLCPGFFWPYNRGVMERALTDLGLAASAAGIEIRLLGGAEIRLSPEIASLAESRELPTLGDSPYVLVEMPRCEVPFWTFEILRKIQRCGYRPILAHPELNLELRSDLSLDEDLARQGVCMQVNAGSLLGRWGSEAGAFALRLLRQGRAQLVASDTHSTRRPPERGAAKAVVVCELGNQVAEALFEDNPSLVLSGGEIAVVTKRSRARSRLTPK